MTGEEIRQRLSIDAAAILNAENQWPKVRAVFEIELLAEIAAQLAEQNQQIRDDRLQRKVWRDEDQIANKARDAMMTQITGMQQKVAAPMIAPAVRVDFPGTVQHLGCIIREPDGAYKIATNQGGLLELSVADFQRLFSPPVDKEVKPQ